MRGKRLLAILVSSITMIGLVGCGSDDPLSDLSKKELVGLANVQQGQLDDNTSRIQELELLLQGVQEVDAPTASISTMKDGTDRLTFNSLAGKIVFPSPFEYPASSQAPNTSSINITTTLSISPTKNWAAKLNGTTLELEQTSGISGTIKAGYIENIYDRELLQEEVMSTFFAELPPDKIKYSKLFLNDQWWGVDAQTNTRIDGEPARLRCGMLGLGEQSFVYIFVYKGEQDENKDETILTLLQTMRMFGQNLSIE